MMEPAGNSIYNSLQLTAEKRFSRGFTILANYTFAKTIDNNVGSANKGNGTNVTDPVQPGIRSRPGGLRSEARVQFLRRMDAAGEVPTISRTSWLAAGT